MLTEKKWMELYRFRHDLHQHPELAMQENRTSARIQEYLEQEGLDIITPTSLKTGVVAALGPKDAPIIALRADIDALPIQEKTKLDYQSKNDGIMHACGHDLHTVSLLAVAVTLKEQEESLKVRLLFVFQPAEETHEGAQLVLESGVLDDAKFIIGFHNDPTMESGSLSIEAGARNAAVDQFKVKLHGKGGHAAHPDKNVDSILGMAHVVTAVQSIVSRNIDPQHPSVLSVTHVDAGSTWNVIPDDAFFEGTIRTFSKEDQVLAKKRFEQIVELQSASFGITADIEWIAGPPVLWNDEELSKEVHNALSEKLNIVSNPASAGGEDFAFYTQSIPAVFAEIGSGANNALHHSDLQVEDEAMKTAADWYVEASKILSNKLN
ncbi:amidohydrolase [Fructobacillus sp. M2-14]|uniref:Amidohydrolase n=1 Tax=Fructobacillus broussonetiae TaxID=2713173 RepID=A0ABS5QY72_9LACO|nr:amidohydrolase [Fructobacillus broussonetiae]MBS9338139.1 amidohydrolase [Fructobacillus broussonetiae]